MDKIAKQFMEREARTYPGLRSRAACRERHRARWAAEQATREIAVIAEGAGFALVSENQLDSALLAREQSERDAAKAALEQRQIPMFP